MAVTDGTHIVLINQAGEIPAWRAPARPCSVYLTLPAGYEIPVADNMALFYKEIKAVKGVFTAHFVLHKMKQDDLKHYAMVWADPQINNQEEANQLLGHSGSRYQRTGIAVIKRSAGTWYRRR